MITNNDKLQQDLILKAIERGIAQEGERLMKEAIENVQKELTRRTPEIVSGITVDVMKMTEYAVLQDRVVFTIKTKQDEK